MYRLLLTLALVTAVGCHAQKPPELRVVGARHEVVYVQVTNPASHSMHLTKLDYKFAADGGTVSQGELPLAYREVPAGSTVIVEIPVDTDSEKPMTMTGQLTAELDEIVRTFQVSAQIQPH
jgi:LEA14-like dessication related protein